MRLRDQSEILMEMLDIEGARLLALLKRLTLREDVAEELLQELVVRLLESRVFSRADNKVAFARRCAINLAFNWRRASRRERLSSLSSEEVPSRSPSAQEQVADAEQFQAILEAGESLNGLRREVFVMHYVENESYESIAMQLNKTPQQARGLAHKAVEDIRRRLDTSRRAERPQDPRHVQK